MTAAVKLSIAVLVAISASFAGDVSPEVKSKDLSLVYESKHAAEKALSWLASRQDSAGFWSQKGYPALTALVLRCFLNAGQLGIADSLYRKNIDNGFKYLESCVQKDGGIYVEGLGNYNTAICLTVFVTRNDPRYDSIIVRANNYLVGLQMDKGKKGSADSIYDGGIGYNKENHSDMSNMNFALEGLYLAKKYVAAGMGPVRAEKTVSAGRKLPAMQQLNWKAATDFISRCQNLPATNKLAWATGDSAEKGGFVYSPTESKAGKVKAAEGSTSFRSYGSMTYAGLLSFMYCEMPRNDKRIAAAYGWLQKNYTLGENPGMGQEGLYYYYHLMAKALKIFKVDTIDVAGKGKVAWRQELTRALINKQDGNGFWINTAGRWWENDPTLCTSYAVLALEMIAQ